MLIICKALAYTKYLGTAVALKLKRTPESYKASLNMASWAPVPLLLI